MHEKSTTRKAMPKPGSALSVRARLLQRKCACGGSSASGECEECKKKELQRKAAGLGGGGNAPPIVHEVLNSPGQSLDAQTRSFFEPRFGHDFSKVRVHTDRQANQSARAVNALAYTVGNDLVFGAGQFAPTTTGGQLLLAHELTHTLQQSGPTEHVPTLRLGQIDSPSEREADQMADAVVSNEPSGVRVHSEMPSVQRQPDRLPPDRPVPTGPQKLPKPNQPPSCSEICDAPDMCTWEKGEECAQKTLDAVSKAWTDLRTNLQTAIDNYDEKSPGAALQKSLKDNFGWSKGDSPSDLPSTVKTNLQAALKKSSENLCVKCRDCPEGAVAYVEMAQGKPCLAFNCYVICKSFIGAGNKAHVLLHELLHRVVMGAAQDLYRGQSGYPPVPSEALKLPDAHASLVDDLVAAAPPPPP